MLQSFPKHDTIRLRSDNFIQWKYQLQLLLDAYDLTCYLDGSTVAPQQMIADVEGGLSPNPSYNFSLGKIN